MEDKYMVILWEKKWDEESNETIRELVHYDSVPDKARLLALLGFLGKCVPKNVEEEKIDLSSWIDVYEVMSDNKIKVYEFFNFGETDDLDGLFEHNEELSKGDDRIRLFRALMNTRKKLEREKYKIIVVKNKIEDDKLVTDILSVYNPEDKAEVLKLFKGPVGFVAFGDRLDSIVFEKPGVEVYLYEWTEKSPGVCVEYKSISSNRVGENIDDFFKYAEKKTVENTLLAFDDYLKKFERPCPSGSAYDVMKEWGL